jgi:hypothetical protein
VKRAIKLIDLDQIAFYKLDAFDDRLSVALYEIVVDHNCMTIADQLLGYYTSNIAGAAGHKYTHVSCKASNHLCVNSALLCASAVQGRRDYAEMNCLFSL